MWITIFCKRNIYRAKDGDGVTSLLRLSSQCLQRHRRREGGGADTGGGKAGRRHERHRNGSGGAIVSASAPAVTRYRKGKKSGREF
jgi:hypothetical protein